MQKINKRIEEIDEVIYKNINHHQKNERGFLSQNILTQLRNLVELISTKIYFNDRHIVNQDFNKETLKAGIIYIKSKGEYAFLYKFHNLLQKSVSHYTFGEENSERLMLKYYEYLLIIKKNIRKNSKKKY